MLNKPGLLAEYDYYRGESSMNIGLFSDELLVLFQYRHLSLKPSWLKDISSILSLLLLLTLVSN